MNAGYPQPGISLELSRNIGVSFTPPVSNGIEIDFDKIKVGVNFSGDIRSSRHLALTNPQHSVNILAQSRIQQVNPQMRIAAMACGMYGGSQMLSPQIRGFLRSCRIVRKGGIDYPCRSVRFKLHTDILPNENGKFDFNSVTEGGLSMDLGQYKFSDDDGIFRLDIDRNERVPLPIQDPHKWSPGSQGNPMKRVLWEATAERPAKYVSQNRRTPERMRGCRL